MGVSNHWTGFSTGTGMGLERGTGLLDWNVGLERGTGLLDRNIVHRNTPTTHARDRCLVLVLAVLPN